MAVTPALVLSCSTGGCGSVFIREADQSAAQLRAAAARSGGWSTCPAPDGGVRDLCRSCSYGLRPIPPHQVGLDIDLSGPHRAA